MTIQKFFSLLIVTLAATLTCSLDAFAKAKSFLAIDTVDDCRTYRLIIDDDSPTVDNSVEIKQAIEDLMNMGVDNQWNEKLL